MTNMYDSDGDNDNDNDRTEPIDVPQSGDTDATAIDRFMADGGSEVSVETADQISGPRSADSADVQAARDQYGEKRREKEKEAVENLSLREKLESARKEKRVHVEIDGIDVPFTPPGVEASQTLLKIGSAWNKMESDDSIGPDQMANAIDTNTNEVIGILAKHAADPGLDREFWRDYGLAELLNYAGKLNTAAQEAEGIDNEQIEGFR